MGDIFCCYEISNPTNVIRPNDLIKGVFYVRSEDKKSQTLKVVEIQLVESWEEYEERTKGNWDWRMKENVLKKYPLAEGATIDPGEEKNYPFEIKLNTSWKPKTGPLIHNFRDWYIALQFCQKTGTFTTRGANKDEATCILPVQGSDRPGSFHSGSPTSQNPAQQELPGQTSSIQAVVPVDTKVIENIKSLIAKGNELILDGKFLDSSIIFEQAKNLAEKAGDTTDSTFVHSILDDLHRILVKGSKNQVKDQRWEKFEKILKLYSEVTLDKLTQLLGFNTTLDLEDWLLNLPTGLPFKVSGDQIKIESANVIPALAAIRLKNEIQATTLEKDVVPDGNVPENIPTELPLPPADMEVNDQIAYWMDLGKNLQSCGKNDNALDAYYKAISLDANNPNAWLNLGIVLASLKRNKEALDAFWKAKNSAPTNWPKSFLVEHWLQQLGENKKEPTGARQTMNEDRWY